MLPPSESEISNERLLHCSTSSINFLYHKIRKILEERNQLHSSGQSLNLYLQEIKVTVSSIIDQFHAQEKGILSRFDNWIKPFAEEVLSDRLLEVDQLRKELEFKLDNLDRVSQQDLDEQASYWMEWYLKWSDRKNLISKVLEIVVDRTTHLVDKDIQVIQDYQMQSLSGISQQAETFRNVEERLGQAIEGPLKQLKSLKSQAKEHTSLQQASEWVAKLQERREGYFDQLLMKIDHVMKDVVQLEETIDLSLFVEIEGEIVFMEEEFQQIDAKLPYIHLMDESDKQFLCAQLEGLLDHVAEIQGHSLPCPLKVRINTIKLRVEAAMTLVGSE